MARKMYSSGAYVNGAPSREWWENSIQYGRNILDGMIGWGEKFGTEYEFNNPNQKYLSTVRADYIGRPARWVNKKIGPATMLEAWSDSTWNGEETSNNKPKDIANWTNEVREFRKQVFGFKFNEDGVLEDYESYAAAVVFTIIKGIMDFVKNLHELWAGWTHVEKDKNGNKRKIEVDGVKDRIMDRINRRRDSHLHGLDKSKITQKTVFNIDLDAFSGSQQGAIMKVLTGEDKALKDVGALSPEVVKMLDRIIHDSEGKCAVILTCNSPQARAICEANLAKLHTGQYAINANNGAYVAAIGNDGQLHVLNDDRIDTDAMTDIANYFIPGTVPRLGLAGQSNVELMYHTPVNLNVKDLNGVDTSVTAKIDWDMVVVDKDGKEHVVPIVPAGLTIRVPGRGIVPDPRIKEAEDKLRLLQKDGCQSITFRPNKESMKANIDHIVQSTKGGKAMTTKEQSDLIYQMTQAGSSAFWLTFYAENSLLQHCRNLKIIPSSNGGFHLLPNGTSYDCSSYNGARFAASQMGFDPNNEMFNFLSTHESMSEPVSLIDSAMGLELKRIKNLHRMKGTKLKSLWKEIFKDVNDDQEQLMHRMTETYKSLLYTTVQVKSHTKPVRKINKEVLDLVYDDATKRYVFRRLVVIGNSSLTKNKLSLSIAGRAAGKWKKVIKNSKSRETARMKNVNAISSGSTFLQSFSQSLSNICRR